MAPKKSEFFMDEITSIGLEMRNGVGPSDRHRKKFAELKIFYREHLPRWRSERPDRSVCHDDLVYVERQDRASQNPATGRSSRRSRSDAPHGPLRFV
ncbi:hypothetical protein IMZ48_44775 [Candidatus Bathyarchaeota archaeon]|nr:hypothetical protein [Candidatus Bathyarchaeota archaeon]